MEEEQTWPHERRRRSNPSPYTEQNHPGRLLLGSVLGLHLRHHPSTGLEHRRFDPHHRVVGRPRDLPGVTALGGEEPRPILHSSKSSETSRKLILELIKNTGERIHQRGPTSWPRGWGRALPPGPPPCLVGPLVALRCRSSAI